MSLVSLPKPKNLVTEIYIIPLGYIRVGSTPYEPNSPEVGNPTSFYPDSGGALTSHVDRVVMVDTLSDFASTVGADPTPAAIQSFIQSKTDTARTAGSSQNTWYFSSYKNFGIGAFKQIRFEGADGVGTGWEFNFTVEGGSDVNHQIFQSGRGLGIWVTQWVDGVNRTPYFNGQVATCYIKYDGGRKVKTMRGGRSVVNLVAATIDHFIDVPLDKLPFFNLEQATAERALWAAEVDPTTGLNYTDDPFQGFAAPFDTYGLDPTVPFPIPPCNENHLISNLSMVKALKHILNNHVLVSKDNRAWKKLGLEFFVNFPDTDEETKIIAFNKEQGTILASCLEACRHGVWQFWANSLNQLTFSRDYCAKPGDALVPGSTVFPLVIIPGKSLLGTLDVNPGRQDTRIARVEVTGQPQLAEALGSLSSMNYFTTFGKAIFPQIPLADIAGGIVYKFDGFLGFHVYRQARRVWALMSQETRATLSDYPWANVFMMMNNVVSISGKDPQGLYDYTPGALSEFSAWVGKGLGDVYYDSGGSDGLHYDTYGKRFKPTGISVSFQQFDGSDPTFGILSSTINMTEIIYYPSIGGMGVDQPTYDPHPEPVWNTTGSGNETIRW